VDIDAAGEATEKIIKLARKSARPEVLAGPGLFGGLFELKGYRQPVLVSSIDGAGTKLAIAGALNKHDTIGVDLVNHCVNDILTAGAEPLFFLDYFATGKLNKETLVDVVKGLSKACREAGCALIGGETAEMPGLYKGEDYDLAGCIVGAVEKDKMLTGAGIKQGDVLVGLLSSGLHTNGYSLVRKIFGQTKDKLDKHYPELGRKLGEELLIPHRCYLKTVKPFLPIIKGMAHITGGGLIDNIPRCLPEGTAAEIDTSCWKTPAIFNLIQDKGEIDTDEMYRVFNMGIGMVLFCSFENATKTCNRLPDAIIIGRITTQESEGRVILK